MSRQIHASSELPRRDPAVDSQPSPQPSPVAAALSLRQSTSRGALEKSIKHMNDAQRTVQDKISFFGHENERPVLRLNGSIEGREGREGREGKEPPKVASPKSAFGTSWYSEESPSERKCNAKVKVTYSHIGFGPEDEVRIRLRETLSASSVRIEAEDEQGALSATEIRILTEELCKFGRREQANCQNLTLGFCGLSDDAAQELGGMLSKNKRLEVLNLWDNKIATSGGESIGQGLRSNITLKFLNMRSNDLGPLGALGIAKGLMDNNALLSLSIRYNWIGDDGAKAFAALLLSNNTIRELDVSRNRIGSEGTQALMKALWHNQSLTDLNLQLNHIYDKGGLFIGSALSHNETLESLDFMGCLLGDAGCVSIFQSLGAASSAKVESEQQMRRKKNLVANHKVKFLLLSGNEIGDIGGLTMGLALKVNRGLVRLDLSKNRLRDKGATALGDALASNNVLEELNLSSNSIADAGLRSLADAMSVNSTLTMLDVTNNAASFKTGVGGILDNLKLTTFRSDLNLVRAELFAMSKTVRGFQQNISNAFEGPGKVQRPVEIFANLSRSLMSLRSLDNKLGHESPAEISNTLGEFLNQSSQLLDLNLARNNLRCDHIKVLSFSTLTFLDISQNSISNSGMDYLVGSLIKVKPSPLIRELDLSHNQIYKIPTGLAHLTSLECLFLEGNHVIRMVAMSAVQAGIKSVTQWIIKWARMQLELAQVAKGQVIKDNTNTQGADEDSSVSPTTSPLRPATSPRKSIGCCSEYPALYEQIPCFAVFGTAKRFKNDTDEIDSTPGPADASPWIHCKEGDKYQRVVFQENWRNIVARTKADSNSYKNGAVISHTAELDDEQEEAVLAVRDALLQDSFNGRSALPSDWAEPRNKIMLQKAKEAQRLRKFHVVKRPEYREQYGVKSIVSRIKRDYPQWQINDIQVIRTLKKHAVYHSDQRHFEMRPALETARNVTPEPGVVPVKPSIKEQEEWKSRVIFLKGFNAVFRSKKLQGFSQFMIRTLEAETHEKVMDLARTYWRTVQVNDKPLWDTSNEQEAARRVREFVRQVYIESFTLGYYNKEDFYKHARFVLKRNPQGQDDETSIKLIQQGSFMGLFRYCDPPSPIPRASFMDSMLREASSLADVGPGSYDPDYYHALGADSEKGPTMALPLELPPNTVPGPGAYFPDHAGRPKEPQADKKILPHYIVRVGGSNIEPQMQELVTCLPNAVADAKQWLEEVGPSLGLQVQLLKAQNWLGNVDVTPRPHPPKKLRPATTTTTPRPNSTATCKIAEESAK